MVPAADLRAAAEAAVDCLGVAPADAVLVVCNDEQLKIAESLTVAARPRGCAHVLQPTVDLDDERVLEDGHLLVS